MSRIEELIKTIPSDVDGILITSDMNRKYYTGLRSSAGTILATRSGCWFIIDSRYFEFANQIVKGFEIILQDKLYEQLLELFNKANVKNLSVESDFTTLRQIEELSKNFADININNSNVLSDAINSQRRIKSAREIEYMASAQKIADKTFTHILNFIKVGVTEKDIALEMEFFSRKNGSEGASFSFIVASGKNSSLPHAVPSDKPVAFGDFITMDYGAKIQDYCSDMTRTVAVGEISEKQQRLYNTVLKAQLNSLEVIKAGVICCDVDKVARDIIDSSEFKGCFGHGLGHSLGLDIHESPNFKAVDKTVLEPNMLMTIEPGIYLSGEFGVRIEDTVVVTSTGYDNLATSSKDLILL